MFIWVDILWFYIAVLGVGGSKKGLAIGLGPIIMSLLDVVTACALGVSAYWTWLLRRFFSTPGANSNISIGEFESAKNKIEVWACSVETFL